MSGCPTKADGPDRHKACWPPLAWLHCCYSSSGGFRLDSCVWEDDRIQTDISIASGASTPQLALCPIASDWCKGAGGRVILRTILDVGSPNRRNGVLNFAA